MRLIYIYLTLFVLFLSTTVQAQELDWVTPEQSINNESGTAVTVLKQGHIYTAGDLGGPITFGEGTVNETVVDGSNYVARYTSSGELTWVTTILADGGFPLDINGIDLDAAGNVYIAGSILFGDTYTFGAGGPNETMVSTNGNARDLFIAHFNKKGDFQWVRSGGINEENGASAITVANNGDSYTTGFFRANIVLGAEGNTPSIELTSEGGVLDNDIFIVKFDKQGDIVWAKSAGGAAGSDTGFGISLDQNQDLYVSGHFLGGATFGKDTPSEINIASDGSLDGFIARYDTAGDPIWALGIGGSGAEQANAIVARKGQIQVAGLFTADFDLPSTDASSLTVPVVLTDNYYLARYDENGVLEWGGAVYFDDLVNFNIDVDIGPDEQSCVMGSFMGLGIFGIGQDGITVLNAPMDSDMFMGCYKDNGILQWADSDPAPINAGAVAADGSIIVTGGYQGSTTFGPGDPNEVTLNNEGSNDIFLAKYENNVEAFGFVKSRRSDRVTSENKTEDYQLGAYPNPFNPESRIRFTLQEDSPVSLVVYDVTGKEVARLLDGQQNAGTHEVVFNANDLPSGLYLYQLVSPAGIQSQTMLLMK